MLMNENPKKMKRGRRRLIRFVCSLLSIVVLTYIAVTLISGRSLELFSIFGNNSDRRQVEMADEYYFDVGRNRVFADLGGSPVAAGTLGVQVLDAGGDEVFRDSFRMSYPAISALGGRAVVFDISGTSLRVLSKTEIIVSLETGGPIVSASINQNGWIAVCTQETVGSKGLVTVYNNEGRAEYKVNFARGYVLSAQLSPDNRSIVILNLTDDGSRFSFYNLSSEEVERVFDLPGVLILDMRYLASGEVRAISKDALMIVGNNNASAEIYRFDGRFLGGYSLDGGFLVLHLLDYNVGHSGCLVTIGEDGSLLGEMETDKEIVSMSVGGGYLAILHNDGIVFYSADLEELPMVEESAFAAGTAKVLAIGEGAALAAGDHSAMVFRIDYSIE